MLPNTSASSSASVSSSAGAHRSPAAAASASPSVAQAAEKACSILAFLTELNSRSRQPGQPQQVVVRRTSGFSLPGDPPDPPRLVLDEDEPARRLREAQEQFTKEAKAGAELVARGRDGFESRMAYLHARKKCDEARLQALKDLVKAQEEAGKDAGLERLLVPRLEEQAAQWGPLIREARRMHREALESIQQAVARGSQTPV